jgi:hypothetical protein
MTNLLLCKRMASLIPIDDAGKDALASLGVGEIVRVKLSRPRNLGHHRKFFSMIQLVFENQEKFPTLEHLLTAVKIEAGWYEDVPIEVSGKLVYLPKSISFAKMDQNQFELFYEKAIAACCRLLPHMNADDIRQEVIAYAA